MDLEDISARFIVTAVNNRYNNKTDTYVDSEATYSV